jgi:hypothetical protein
MMIDVQRKTVCIGIIGAMALSLSCFAAFAQSPSDIEQRLKQFEQRLQGTTDMNEVMQAYNEALGLIDGANRKVGGITGVQAMATMPAETPEKEMDRRRETINGQFRQVKDMIGSFPAAAEKLQIPEAYR